MDTVLDFHTDIFSYQVLTTQSVSTTSVRSTVTKTTLSRPCGVQGAKEKCLQCHELHVETDTEEGALDSAQMHRGDSALRWGVTLQGEQRRHTGTEEQGARLRWGATIHSGWRCETARGVA